MLTDETLKAVIEGILYVAPEPVTLDAIVKSLGGEERGGTRPFPDDQGTVTWAWTALCAACPTGPASTAIRA